MGEVVKFGLRLSQGQLDDLESRLDQHLGSLGGFIETLSSLEDAENFKWIVQTLGFIQTDVEVTRELITGLKEKKPRSGY